MNKYILFLIVSSSLVSVGTDAIEPNSTPGNYGAKDVQQYYGAGDQHYYGANGIEDWEATEVTPEFDRAHTGREQFGAEWIDSNSNAHDRKASFIKSAKSWKVEDTVKYLLNRYEDMGGKCQLSYYPSGRKIFAFKYLDSSGNEVTKSIGKRVIAGTKYKATDLMQGLKDFSGQSGLSTDTANEDKAKNEVHEVFQEVLKSGKWPCGELNSESLAKKISKNFSEIAQTVKMIKDSKDEKITGCYADIGSSYKMAKDNDGECKEQTQEIRLPIKLCRLLNKVSRQNKETGFRGNNANDSEKKKNDDSIKGKNQFYGYESGKLRNVGKLCAEDFLADEIYNFFHTTEDADSELMTSKATPSNDFGSMDPNVRIKAVSFYYGLQYAINAKISICNKDVEDLMNAIGKHLNYMSESYFLNWKLKHEANLKEFIVNKEIPTVTSYESVKKKNPCFKDREKMGLKHSSLYVGKGRTNFMKKEAIWPEPRINVAKSKLIISSDFRACTPNSIYFQARDIDNTPVPNISGKLWGYETSSTMSYYPFDIDSKTNPTDENGNATFKFQSSSPNQPGFHFEIKLTLPDNQLDSESKGEPVKCLDANGTECKNVLRVVATENSSIIKGSLNAQNVLEVNITLKDDCGNYVNADTFVSYEFALPGYFKNSAVCGVNLTGTKSPTCQLEDSGDFYYPKTSNLKLTSSQDGDMQIRLKTADTKIMSKTFSVKKYVYTKSLYE